MIKHTKDLFLGFLFILSGIWSIRSIERVGCSVPGVSWSKDCVRYLLEYFISLSWILRIEFSWIRRIGLCFFVVSCKVQAQIRCIFLDGYGILDVRTESRPDEEANNNPDERSTELNFYKQVEPKDAAKMIKEMLSRRI
nr:hypothetical protein [Tanacetum cinerariifolium]